MFRRMFWFVLGVIAGVYGTVSIKKKLLDLGERLTLANVLSALIDGVKYLLDALLDLWKKEVQSRRGDSVIDTEP